jgi:hypothetical protein
MCSLRLLSSKCIFWLIKSSPENVSLRSKSRCPVINTQISNFVLSVQHSNVDWAHKCQSIEHGQTQQAIYDSGIEKRRAIYWSDFVAGETVELQT